MEEICAVDILSVLAKATIGKTFSAAANSSINVVYRMSCSLNPQCMLIDMMMMP